MVKGISRQVIVVHPPEPKLFEQAIFILKDGAAKAEITDEILMKEAEQAIHSRKRTDRHRKIYLYGAFWACAGAIAMGLVWLVTVFIH